MIVTAMYDPPHLPITSTASANFYPSIRSIGLPAAHAQAGSLKKEAVIMAAAHGHYAAL